MIGCTAQCSKLMKLICFHKKSRVFSFKTSLFQLDILDLFFVVNHWIWITSDLDQNNFSQLKAKYRKGNKNYDLIERLHHVICLCSVLIINSLCNGHEYFSLNFSNIFPNVVVRQFKFSDHLRQSLCIEAKKCRCFCGENNIFSAKSNNSTASLTSFWS